MSESEVMLLRQEIPEIQAQVERMLERAEAVLTRAKFPDAYHGRGIYGTLDGLPHPEKRFNVNRLMACFPQLYLEPGYELDYWYHNDGLGGAPVLYTRPKSEKFSPLQSDETAEDITEDIKEGIARRAFLPHFSFERSPAGYLQFAIFSVISDQFYLFWHAAYHDEIFVLSQRRAIKILSRLDNGETREISWDELARADFSVTLEMYSPGFCRLSAVIFTDWGGFKRCRLGYDSPGLDFSRA